MINHGDPIENARRRLVRAVENQFSGHDFVRARTMGNYGACVLLYSPMPDTVSKITLCVDTDKTERVNARAGETVYELDLTFGSLPDPSQGTETKFGPAIAQVLFTRKDHYMLYPPEGDMPPGMFEMLAEMIESAN